MTNRKDLFNWGKFLKGTAFGKRWGVQEFWLVWHKRGNIAVFWAHERDGTQWTIWPLKPRAELAVQNDLFW